MLGQLHLIRAFEETVLELAAEGLVHGPAHSSIGQEGGAVGSIVSLRSSDAVNGSHRGHHQFLAKALTHVTKGSLTLDGLVTPAVAEVLQRTLAEILGLAQGYCGGRGGSMHLQWLEAGALGTNAIVGGGVPMAAGNAWAQQQSFAGDARSTAERPDRHLLRRRRGQHRVGARDAEPGVGVEAAASASSWRTTATRSPPPSRRPPASRGCRPAPSASASPPGGSTAWTRSRCTWSWSRRRRGCAPGEGPVVVEALVYRFFHQNGPYPGSAFGYRTKEEEAGWRARDPLDRVAREMTRLGLIDEAGVAAVRAQAVEAMRAAAAALVEPDPSPGAKAGARRIRPELWPDPAFVNVGVRGDLVGAGRGADRRARVVHRPLRRGKFIDAVSAVMDRRMGDRPADRRARRGRAQAGTAAPTAPPRACPRSTRAASSAPRSARTRSPGLGGGLALDGRFRPVVEFMYPDFLWVAADQVFNQIGKARHMFGGRNPVPLVLRTKVAMGSGYGSQHLMDPAGIFATSPGWRIMAASTPFDYVGLMNAALAVDDPVLMLEHVDLYGAEGEIPVDDLDYQIPFGQAAVRRAGSEVTVLTYLSMVAHAAEAIERTGIDAELIDLRFLDRASLDWDTVGASVRKTNAVLIVEQGALGTSYGGWLADEIQRRFFDWLDQPVQRVHGSRVVPVDLPGPRAGRDRDHRRRRRGARTGA